MHAIRVRGGHRLDGSVWTGGSKNASLPILAATLLCEGPVRLENVPPVRDIMTMLQLLEELGVVWSWQEDGALELEVQDESKCEAPYHLVRQMRAFVSACSARSGPSAARPASRCREAARSANGRSICISRACRRSAARCCWITATSRSRARCRRQRLSRRQLWQHGARHRQRADGCGARQGRDAHRLRGAGAGDRGPVPLPAGLRRRHRRRGQPLPDDPRRAVADGLSTSRDRRSHRGRHDAHRRPDDARRGRSARRAPRSPERLARSPAFRGAALRGRRARDPRERAWLGGCRTRRGALHGAEGAAFADTRFAAAGTPTPRS
jgi:hypothetical protein